MSSYIVPDMKRAHRDPSRPTEGELELFHILWQRGSATVRDIHEKVSQTRPLGYTGVLKLLT